MGWRGGVDFPVLLSLRCSSICGVASFPTPIGLHSVHPQQTGVQAPGVVLRPLTLLFLVAFLFVSINLMIFNPTFSFTTRSTFDSPMTEIKATFSTGLSGHRIACVTGATSLGDFRFVPSRRVLAFFLGFLNFWFCRFVSAPHGAVRNKLSDAASF